MYEKIIGQQKSRFLPWSHFTRTWTKSALDPLPVRADCIRADMFMTRNPATRDLRLMEQMLSNFLLLLHAVRMRGLVISNCWFGQNLFLSNYREKNKPHLLVMLSANQLPVAAGREKNKSSATPFNWHSLRLAKLRATLKSTLMNLHIRGLSGEIGTGTPRDDPPPLLLRIESSYLTCGCF